MTTVQSIIHWIRFLLFLLFGKVYTLHVGLDIIRPAKDDESGFLLDPAQHGT